MIAKPLSDHRLACRLERAEASANAAFVEARARIAPEVGAEWIEVAGAYVMYDGPHSPCTQTFGLGLFAVPSTADFETIETFFARHEAPVFHELSPLADKSLLPLLAERHYHPVDLTTVMFRPLEKGSRIATDRPPVTARLIDSTEHQMWARTAAEGWRELMELSDFMYDLAFVTAGRDNGSSFVAEWDGRPIAAGSLSIHDGIALLAGASTIPEWRNRGAQRALLEARLDFAVDYGCDLAMICAEPGSASQRNAERQGFQIAYTRIKWGRSR